MFCSNCRSLILPGKNRCPVCGESVGGNRLEDFKPHVATVSDNKDAPYLPYRPREGQIEIIADIRNALDDHRHIVVESGTGTGKTIVSLSAGLEHAKRTGKKIIYLTRTISQSDQVMKELKAISSIKPVSGITLTGRNRSCPLFASDEYRDLSPNILSVMCDEKKSKSNRNSAGGCRFYDKTKSNMDDIRKYCMGKFPTSDELDAYCISAGACPYEVRKALIKDFDVIVAPYIHIISEDIRTNFINNIGGEDTPLLLIVDEAHNLIDAVREQESFTISMKLADAAKDECTVMHHPEVSEGIQIDTFVNSVGACIKQTAVNKIQPGKKEAGLDGEFDDMMKTRLKLSNSSFESAIERLIMLGEDRISMLADKGDQASSAVYDLGILLKKWAMSDPKSYVKSIKTGDDGPYLSASCIDPSDIIEFMRSLDGAVHMSGTLKPLDQYAKVMGLPKNSLPRSYPSPFPAENRLVVYAEDVTTRFKDISEDPNMYRKISSYIVRLCNAVNKNTLVFMPSYRVMRELRPAMESGIDRPLYWEESGRQKNTMRSLNRFRSGTDGVFVCVMGGSVAEGMDFPGDELCFAVIVGIPFPPPSMELTAMKDMFDSRYGEGVGWKYTNEVPAIRKMRQAIGRLIRTETDRGMAVILDNRTKAYARQLEARPSRDPVAEAVSFFSER